MLRPSTRPPGRAREPQEGHATAWSKGFVPKLVLVGVVDALGLYGLLAAWPGGHWVIAAVIAGILVVVNTVYFSGRMVPAKYLVPGLILLLVYQVFVIGYTAYASLTNYGDGHNSTKSDALAAILQNKAVRVPGSTTYSVTVLSKDGQLFLLATDPRTRATQLGSAGTALHPVGDTTSTGTPRSPAGYTTLSLGDVLDRQQAVADLRVPLSDDPNAGYLRTADGSTGYVLRSTLRYDGSRDRLVDTRSGALFRDSGKGNFVSATSGKAIEPGWKVNIGLSNFTTVLTDRSLRSPFLGVLAWTFVFAIASVAGTFAIGLFLALALNSPTLGGRRIYRSLLALPYAFPAFLAALVWQGLLNPRFGFVNQVLLGGADIRWLSDPWLARLSVIVVNLWMGFPYMFLVCTGAIQSLPADVEEAARVDGAGWFQIFRLIKLPLLLVATAPLLISSFALNFNNFNSIYLLTGGGPLRHPTDPAGATDILISFVYRLAFGGVNRQYGLACAVSILIFLIVATVSALSFQRTRALEELS